MDAIDKWHHLLLPFEPNYWLFDAFDPIVNHSIWLIVDHDAVAVVVVNLDDDDAVADVLVASVAGPHFEVLSIVVI